MELKQYAYIVKKRLWLISLIVVLVCSAAGFYSLYMLQPQYEASAKLIVNKYKDQSAPMNAIDLNSINTNIQLIKTYKEIIRTPRMMQLVADQYPQLGQSAGELLGKVSVTSVNDTQVMSISVKDDSYARAAQIANAVANVFKEEIPKVMQVDNVSILNLANPQGKAAPVSPNVKMNLIMAFALSLLAGLGLAFLLDYLDDTIKREEDVHAVLGLPSLIVIPKMKPSDFQRGNTSTKSTLPTRGIVGREQNVSLDT